MYIAPWQGQTTPWGQNFYVKNSLSLCPFVASLKKSLWSLIFYRFLCVFFQMYIAPDTGRQHIEDKNFMTTERPFLFSYMLQNWKWSLQNLTLYTFFYYFIHVYSPEAREDKPFGVKILMSTESSSLLKESMEFKRNFTEISVIFTNTLNFSEISLKFQWQR